MEYIKVTSENIEKEHICCAISNNNDIQVASKKAWLSERFEDGLVFLKSTERGKCFIEYIPAENAWNPISADGYMYIDCLWVVGSFKGHGYSADLLNACIEDSKNKGKMGLCILAAAKKKPFLADPKFLKYKGFRVCDKADNGIQLWYLPFDNVSDYLQTTNAEFLDMFLTAKHLEGCSDKTIRYYRCNIEKMLETINVPIIKITTELLRKYLVEYQTINNCGKVTIDSIRRSLSTFL